MATAREGDRSLSIEGVLCVVYAGLAAVTVSQYRSWDRRGPFILAFFLCCMLGFGFITFIKARREGYRLTLIELLVMISIAGVLIGLAMPPVSGHGRRPARTREQTILRQIGLGLTSYHGAQGSFPPAVVSSPEGKPLYSWRVLILPYIDEQQLFDSFHKDEPWDSPHNLTILNSRPRLFDGLRDMDPNETTFQAIVGPGAAFEGRTGITLANFTDGPSRTLLIVDASEPVPWTSPNDLIYAKDEPLPALGPTSEEDRRNLSPSRGPESWGFNAFFADGSTRYVDRSEVDDATLRALITRNGGERIAYDPD